MSSNFPFTSRAAILLCLAGALAAAGCTPKPEPKPLPPARADAVELVRLLGMDSGVVLAVARFFPSPAKGPVPQAVHDCLRKADRSTLINALALTLQKEMSPDDMAKALTFYRTPLAQKFIALEYLVQVNGYVSGAAHELPALSEEETATVNEFVNSPVQDKLLAAGEKIGNDKQLDQFSNTIVEKCEAALQ